MWRRFVALGDSLTEGVGDPGPDGRLRGWADRLAAGLAGEGFDYYNLARLGTRTRAVRVHELPRALELGPDLASVVTGMNDALAPSLDVDALRADLAATVGPLKATGAFVFTAAVPETTPALRLVPGAARRRIEARLAQVRGVIHDVAAAHDVLCFDMDDLPRGFELGICSIDGLHPNARGHLLMAQIVAERLSEHCGTTIELTADSDSWLRSGTRHLRWLTTGGYLRRHPMARLAREARS
ncbi:MAG TPA: SGNH/GDSL hydrolase family protein [Actinomycetota bacterium]|nr:SGNH/GDSL hydrolase family protein [Actinomycetota bacterium]